MDLVKRLALSVALVSGCYQADYSADGGAVDCAADPAVCAEGTRCERGVCLIAEAPIDAGLMVDAGFLRDASSSPDSSNPSPDSGLPYDGGFASNDAGGGLADVGAPVCGNGVAEADELCDDGNLRDGDGCSETCSVEVAGRALWQVASGRTADEAVTSCHALRTASAGGAPPETGVYFVDPDGPGDQRAHQVYCDHDTAGGGWSLIAVEADQVANGSIFADNYCTALGATCAGRSPDWADSVEYLLAADRGWIHVRETNERILSRCTRRVAALGQGAVDNQLIVLDSSHVLIGGTLQSTLQLSPEGIGLHPITNGNTPWWTLNYAESPAHFQAEAAEYTALLYRHVQPDWQALARFAVGGRAFVLGFVEQGILARDVQPACAIAGGHFAALTNERVHERAAMLQRQRTNQGAWIGAREGAGNCNRQYCWYPWDNSARPLNGSFSRWAGNEPAAQNRFVWQDEDGFWRSELGVEPLQYFWCEGAAQLSDLQLLSFEKTATQSSTQQDLDSPQLVAGLAVDGRYSMGGSPGRPENWFAQTTEEDTPWWQVDLGSVRTVREVALWSRDDGGGPDQLADYTVLTSLDGAQWVTFADEPGSAARPSRYFGTAQARYVRVQLRGTQYMAIMEAEVYGY